MQLVTDKITLEELRNMAKGKFGNLVKAVLDIDKEVMVVDAEEFDSMINLRPSDNNFSRGVDDKQVREKINLIVGRLIEL